LEGEGATESRRNSLITVSWTIGNSESTFAACSAPIASSRSSESRGAERERAQRQQERGGEEACHAR
jgi:hypothetical protein